MRGAPARDTAAVLSSAELHGALTHVALVAVPLWGVLALARWVGYRQTLLVAVEPWALGAAVIGLLAAGLTGLLVRGQAQTTLRGGANDVGTAHFWLGIALTAAFVVAAAVRVAAMRRGAALGVPSALAAVGLLSILGAVAQGYLGGRMTYQDAVGIQSGGQLARSAAGAEELEVALAQGVSPRRAGMEAFSSGGLGCADCHGPAAEGARGPDLRGGRPLDRFRHVHGSGLFPPAIVSDRDFAAIDAYLRSLDRPGERVPVR